MPFQPPSADEKKAYYAAGLWKDRVLYEYVDEHAKTRPEKVAILERERRYTYGDLKRYTDGLAMSFVQLGIRPGDVVAVQLPNRSELPICHLALNKAGAIVLPLSDTWRAAELSYLLELTGAQAAVIPGASTFDFPALYRDLHVPSVRHLICVDPVSDGDMLSFWQLAEDGMARYDPEVLRRRRPDPDGFTFLNVSSGTTAQPRCSQWSDNNIAVKLLAHYRERTGLGPDDIAAAIAPAGTGATGYQYPILAPLLVGGTSVLLVRWHPRDALVLVASARATMATLVPTQLIKMLSDPDLKRYGYSALRCITTAGAPLPPEVARKAEAVFWCRIQTVYGATEGGVPAMTSVDDPPDKRYSTVGRPLVGMTVRILDEKGQDVPPGVAGEIAWRGCNKTLGFLGPSGDSDWHQGWFLSGDIGYLDQEGYLHVVGRKKDVIIRGGQNISPREIEDLLLSHADVEEVAVVGYPDPVMGERVCAFVVPKSRRVLHPDALIQFLRAQNIAVWKLPERVEIIDDLPRSAGGKVDKAALRRLAAEVPHFQGERR